MSKTTSTDAGQTMSDAGLDRIFREAYTHNAWRDRPVDDATLAAIFDLAKLGPTSANCCPLRIVFIRSPEAKERLAPHLLAQNVDKTMAAPVTALLAYDRAFHEHLPRLFPHVDARAWFAGNDALIESTAFRNGTLQAAYFIIAARALGLDSGAMSGFDNDGVDREFLAGTAYRSNFLLNLG